MTLPRLFLCTALALAALPARAEPLPTVIVAKTATCGCCGAWVEHMRAAGFTVETRDMAGDALYALKTRLGLTPLHTSCHTGLVGGYVVEGHVPAADVRRLLAEKPQALGLAVPGMPVGSPGMEMGGRVDPYDTLLVGPDGAETVWTAHR